MLKKLVALLTIIACVSVPSVTANAAGWTENGYDYTSPAEPVVYDNNTIYATAMQYLPAEYAGNLVPRNIDILGYYDGYDVYFQLTGVEGYNCVIITLTSDLQPNYGLFGTDVPVRYCWFRDYQ